MAIDRLLLLTSPVRYCYRNYASVNIMNAYEFCMFLDDTFNNRVSYIDIN